MIQRIRITVTPPEEFGGGAAFEYVVELDDDGFLRNPGASSLDAREGLSPKLHHGSPFNPAPHVHVEVIR